MENPIADQNAEAVDGGTITRSPHEEAVEFVEKHRDFFEHFARGRVKVEPAPEGLDTFAFNLENNVIYVNSRFFREFGLPEEGTTFGTLHELVHFLQKKQLVSEPRGTEIFEKYLVRLKDGAYSLMDNHSADVQVNATVQNGYESGREIEDGLYKQVFYKDKDFTKEPRHVQLSYALHEFRGMGDEYEVSPEVRDKMDELKAIVAPDGTKLTDVMFHPETPMSLRLKLQDRYLWPMVKELRDKDLEDKKNEQKDKSEEGAGEGGGENGEEEKGELDPNEVFKEAYDRASKRVPNAVPIEKIEEALKNWKEASDKNSPDAADKKYAENLGVKKQDLQTYRNIVKELEKSIDPETGENIVRELEELIRRIMAKRLKLAHAPRYPMEEGEDLVDPAQLVADVKAGNLEPKVWETFEVKEKFGKKFGEVEITLVCDRSYSMNTPQTKLIEQRRAVVFMMEVLKNFADLADEERINLDKPLEIRSEVFAFSQSDEDDKPLKKMSKELGEKERIDVMVKASSASGGTTDFVPLETIDAGISEENLKKIKEGELKKIVITFTDGDSNEPQRVKNVLEKLRAKGVVVVCIPIGEEGKKAFDTYALAEVRSADKAEKICPVLKDVLKDNLTDL